MKFFNSRSSVFIALFMSFLLIFIVPVTFETILYQRMEQSIRTLSSRANLAMLKQIQQVMDQRLNEVDQLALQVAFHPALQPLLGAYENKTYPYIAFSQELRTLDTNPFVKDFFVYFKNNNYIVTPTIKTTSDVFFLSYYGFPSKSLNEYKEWLAEPIPISEYLPAQTVKSPYADAEEVIPFLQKLPYGSSEPKAILGVLLYKEKIGSLLETIETANHGTVYIFDDQNRLIMKSGDLDHLSTKTVQKMKGQSGVIQTSLKNSSHMLSYAKADNNGWTYVSAVPKTVYTAQLREIQKTALLFLAICVLIGLLLSYYLSLRHYRPLRELAGSLFKHFQGTKRGVNEYQMISNHIEELWDKEKDLRQQVHIQAPSVREVSLRQLLKGIAVPKKGASELKLVSPYIIVLVMDVEDRNPPQEELSYTHWQLVQFVMTNVFEEAFRELGGYAYVASIERDRYALLFNFSKKPNDGWRDRIEHISKSCRKTMKEAFELDVTIGVGMLHNRNDAIRTAYQEALQALEYQFIRGRQAITFFQEIKDTEPHYYYPMDVEEQLMNTIMTGNTSASLQLLDEIFSINFEDRNISLEIGRCLAFNLTSTLLKVFNRLTVRIEPWPQEILQHISKCKTAEDVFDEVKSYCTLICEEVKQQLSGQHRVLYENVKRYVAEQYSDPNLNVASIADWVGLSPQYLSSLFKQFHGQPLKEHIARVRLAHAKSLLLYSDKTVGEVAEAVGYANDIGLIRLFKKYEGVTPGQYKGAPVVKKRRREGE
ncbi:AraC family transcriptional regulator [Bacillaceae bacterium SIJ1]|uniref:helix-turn-helix domain-containing protein n=1 Tax=Litoribacterium kuwaitense TaxID=1398745 RepID=UPI0013EA5334|nr:helix-turn-helix domain-containing protein [Litoribacterium kuwaitense]NGP46294.1 AraC family transcriptional regulator [Litoribacterium kuwaitense]